MDVCVHACVRVCLKIPTLPGVIVSLIHLPINTRLIRFNLAAQPPVLSFHIFFILSQPPSPLLTSSCCCLPSFIPTTFFSSIFLLHPPLLSLYFVFSSLSRFYLIFSSSPLSLLLLSLISHIGYFQVSFFSPGAQSSIY